MRYLIDSSAWIEYFSGSKEGEKVNEVLKHDNEVYVISPIISEVIRNVRAKNKDYELAYESIIKNSKIFTITPKIAKEAGLMNVELRKRFGNFPLIDTLIICSAKELNTKILTADNHFKHFKEAIIL